MSNISVYDPNLSNPHKRLASFPPDSQHGNRSSKKSRQNFELSDDAPPSHVVVIENLPPNVTENEVAGLAAPFGHIVSMVLTRMSGFGLIEMANQMAAEDMVDYYSRIYTPSIRGTGPLIVAFSRYTSLQNAGITPQASEAIMNANKHFEALSSSGFFKSPRTVVRVRVFQSPPGIHFGYMQFYRLFHKFGRILRIIAFKSGALPNAFLEFDNPLSAQVAIVQCDGVPMPMRDVPGTPTCVMRLDFSHQPTIDVRTEDVNCRDFTRNPAPEYDRNDRPSPLYNGQNDQYGDSDRLSPLTPNNVLRQLTEDRLAQLETSVLSELASRMVKPLLKAALSAGSQQSSFLKSQAEVLEHLAPRTSRMGSGAGRSSQQPMFSGGFSMDDEPNQSISSPVVYVSNLNQERVTPDNLFILFGVYGDVQRVKILHGKKDCALIQYAELKQAHLAISYLDKQPFYGKQIRCSSAKVQQVNIPTPGKDNTEASADNISQLNREYVAHRLHRFRWANARTYHNLCAPSKFLHIVNLPDAVSEEDIQDAFVRIAGVNPLGVKVIRASKLMALVQLEDIEQAIGALVAMHDYEIETNYRIRVSFTKSTFKP
ncbi:unnamed protein product [Dicrocoelium dendriticum]|nr:unnamed protein product [Dicrocoelium dendriticum]